MELQCQSFQLRRFGFIDLHDLTPFSRRALREISKESMCFCKESCTLGLLPDVAHLSHFLFRYFRLRSRFCAHIEAGTSAKAAEASSAADFSECGMKQSSQSL